MKRNPSVLASSLRTRGVASVILGIGVAPLVFVPTRARAQCEQVKVTASDAVGEGYFGGSVSISGDVAVIGAEGNGEAGSLSGAAYVFRRVGSAWVEKQKLVASDAFESDRFGHSVAVSGNTVMVTAPYADTVVGDDGAVYVFRWDGTHWVEQQKLLASDAFLGHRFGRAISLDGNVAAVGQIGDSFAGNPESGALYVFHWNGGSWVQEQKLAPPDLGDYDHFGFSVSLKGSVVVAGAPQQDPFGAVYVFRWNGASWVQEQKITASDGAIPDGFGRSVATYQNVLVAGVPNHHGAFAGSGKAYVYRFNGSTWGDEQQLNPPAEVQYRSFGQGLSVLGDHLLVGATGAGAPGPASGAVYLYTLKEAQWVEARELVPTDAIPVQGFGFAVSLGPDRAVVGASSDDDACPGEPHCASGSAYIYDIPLCVPVIPAASAWGLVVLALSVLVVGVLLLRRRGALEKNDLDPRVRREIP